MPEEINRIVTDRLFDYPFVTEKSGITNLKNEGVADNKIFFTGNIMIDSLIGNFEIAKESKILDELSLKPQEYAALTLHRPANVDNKDTLKQILNVLTEIGKGIPIVFPCHPRTQKNLEKFGLLNSINKNAITIIEPIGYPDFLKLQSESKFVLTDSGGIQEETTYMGIPCITLREDTERPVTVEIGTNTITGIDPDKILQTVGQINNGNYKSGSIPELWGLLKKSLQGARKATRQSLSCFISYIQIASLTLAMTRIRVFQQALWDGKTAQRIVDILKQ